MPVSVCCCVKFFGIYHKSLLCIYFPQALLPVLPFVLSPAAAEEYFRDQETNLLKELQEESNLVISCGGGAALRACNVAEMKKNGRVVLLTASPEVILDRVKDSDDRPVLKGRKSIEGITELMEQRRERYEAAADIVIQTDHKSVQEICEELIQRLSEMDEE